MKIKVKGRPKWTPNREHPLSPHQRKKRKRAEAIDRASRRAVRTAADQLAIIRQRPGESKRERARLSRGSP